MARPGMTRLLKNRMPLTWAHLAEHGWEVEGAGRKGHLRATHPSGRKVPLPSSPSAQNTDRNYLTKVQRIEQAALDAGWSPV